MDECRYIRYSDAYSKDYLTHKGKILSLLPGNWSRPREYSLVYNAVNRFSFPGHNILDLGAGSPKKYPIDIMLADSKNRYNVYVQDISFEGAEKLFDMYNIKYKIGNIAELKYLDNMFPIIISISVIEHMNYEDFKSMVKESYRILRQYGGIFILTADLTYNYKMPISEHCNLERQLNKEDKSKKIIAKERFDADRIIREFKDAGYLLHGCNLSKKDILLNETDNLCVFFGVFVKM